MAELFSKKHADASHALKTLEEALSAEHSSFVQDAAIQRFEYTTEAFWKCLQSYLKEREGIVSSSPKSCIREAAVLTILNEEDAVTALEMIDDRNLTSHMYHAEIAESIYPRLPMYANVMKRILEELKTKL